MSSSLVLYSRYTAQRDLAGACNDAAQALETACDGVDRALDASVEALTAETWHSNTATIRRLELADLRAQTIDTADTIVLLVRAVRAKGETADAAAVALWSDYLDAVAREMVPPPPAGYSPAAVNAMPTQARASGPAPSPGYTRSGPR